MRVVAITPQTVEKSREMIEKRKFPFPMLRDEKNEVAAQFGLQYRLEEDLQEVYEQLGLNLPESNGEDTWTLPMPARYVVDSTGRIRWSSVSGDYRDRPEWDDTLEAAMKVEGGTARSTPGKVKT